MSSKADRPYGHFPVEGDEVDLPPAPPPGPVRLRDRILGTGRSRRIRVTAGALGVLFIVAGMVGAAQPAPTAIPPRPTPRPTPTVAEIYEQVAPSVVAIRASSTGKDPSTGSGVIVDETPLILTSLHVVSGAQRILLTFADGFETEAQVVGQLPERDIAVLQPYARPSLVIPAVLGDPQRSVVGSEVFVIADPFGLTRSYSAGIVSGLNRTVRFSAIPQPVDRLIQFDAAVNPGSSGGPLIDRRGEVIGIVAGIPEAGRGAFAGIGFAVPINLAGGALGIPID